MSILNGSQEGEVVTFEPWLVSLFAAVIDYAVCDLERAKPAALTVHDEGNAELIRSIKDSAEWFVFDPDSPIEEWAVITGHPIKEIRRRLKAGDSVFGVEKIG